MCFEHEYDSCNNPYMLNGIDIREINIYPYKNSFVIRVKTTKVIL